MNAAERIGAPAQIRLSELAIHAGPPGCRIMAALSGYFDDSRTDGLVLTIAGYLGEEWQWNTFEERWQADLDRNGVPYFHMKEFCDPDGPYKKWLPAEKHQSEISQFFGALARTIKLSRLKGFGSIVRLKDLERFNEKHNQTLEPYPLAVYGCMIWIGKCNPQSIVSAIFDRVEQVSSKLAKAQVYAESDTYYQGVTDLIQPIPLNRALTWRNVRPLQAADFAAWEIRKHHLNQNEWWELKDRPTKVDEAILHMMEWSQRRFGTQLPARKSLEALLESAEIPGVLWDYHTLCEAHEARGGVWA